MVETLAFQVLFSTGRDAPHLAFSADGSYLFVGGDDLTMLDATSGDVLRTLATFESPEILVDVTLLTGERWLGGIVTTFADMRTITAGRAEFWRVPVLTGVRVPDCTVRATFDVSLRSGPGATFDAAGILAGGEVAAVSVKTTGEDGFVWWGLVRKAWVRSDVVTAGGDCDPVPVME